MNARSSGSWSAAYLAVDAVREFLAIVDHTRDADVQRVQLIAKQQCFRPGGARTHPAPVMLMTRISNRNRHR